MVVPPEQVRVTVSGKRVERDVDASPGRVPHGLRDLLGREAAGMERHNSLPSKRVLT